MNGILNSNFFLGFMLAQGLPSDKQFSVGLTASQFPPNNMLGPLLLKPLLDEGAAQNVKNADLQSEVKSLRRPFQIQIPTAALGAGADAKLVVTLSIPEAQNEKWTPVKAGGFALDDQGKLEITKEANGKEILLFAHAEGVTRTLKVKVTDAAS